MGMKYAEVPFNMGSCFFYLRRPSEWVHFLTPNTHIRAFLYWSCPPPPTGSQINVEIGLGSISMQYRNVILHIFFPILYI